METLIYAGMWTTETLALYWRRVFGVLGMLGFFLFSRMAFNFFRLLVWHSGRPRAYELMFKNHPEARAEVARDLERTLDKLRKPPVK
jgi:hypothetical protein